MSLFVGYAAIDAALLAQLAAGLTGLNVVINSEPQSIEGVSLYLLGKEFTRNNGADQVTVMRYQQIIRLATAYGSGLAAAEARLRPYVNSVCAAVDADGSLGRLITNGVVTVTGGVWGFWLVSGVDHRILDITVSSLEKAPYKSGI